MTTRTAHRSKTGKKLYAVRDKKGRFVDIQTYKRAHGAAIKRKSRKEKKAKGKYAAGFLPSLKEEAPHRAPFCLTGDVFRLHGSFPGGFG
jgi:hypothetical protein